MKSSKSTINRMNNKEIKSAKDAKPIADSMIKLLSHFSNRSLNVVESGILGYGDYKIILLYQGSTDPGTIKSKYIPKISEVVKLLKKDGYSPTKYIFANNGKEWDFTRDFVTYYTNNKGDRVSTVPGADADTNYDYFIIKVIFNKMVAIEIQCYFPSDIFNYVNQ